MADAGNYIYKGIKTKKMRALKRLFSPKLQSVLILFILGCIYLLFVQPAQSDQVLQGSVQENDAITRLSRPNSVSGTGQSDSLRINRNANNSPMSGLVDTSQFSTPLSGNASAQGRDLSSQSPGLGLVRPDEFKNLSASKFDLGADRGSKELTIGWERWYKQLSGAIYSRWSRVADISGHAVVRLTVSKDRVLNAEMVSSSGSREFDNGLINAILSLNGNPGLTFPSQSQRQSVSLESDYIAGTNIDPGYSWIKNDYEKVDESY